MSIYGATEIYYFAERTMSKLNRAVKLNLCTLKYKLVLLICIFLTKNITTAQSIYYEDKNLRGYIDDISSIKAPLDSHTEKMITIQISFMVNTNPSSYKELLDNIDDIPEHLRLAVVQGMVNIKGKDIEINKNYKLVPKKLIAEIDNFTYLLPSNNKEKMVVNTDGTDYLWAAIAITGNRDYLKRIITFLNQFPPWVRTVAFELENRKAIDKAMFKLTGVQGNEVENLLSQLTTEERYEIMTYDIVSWSLESNKKQYPVLDFMINSIQT